jgi:hypothetical protein
MDRINMQMAVIFLVVGFFAPMTAAAGGLIPCGGDGQAQCQTCDVVKLMDNLIDWLIAILSIVAAILIAYAGVRLVLSVGDASAKEFAKRSISNVIIGYVLLLACWLLVDTAVKFLLSDQAYGTWNQIQCTEQPQPRVAEQETVYFGWVGGTINYQCTPLPNGQFNCTDRINECISDGGTTATPAISSTPSVACSLPASASRPPDLSLAGACNADVVGRYFPEDVGNAQCIIRAESTCGAANVSRTDVMGDGRAFSFGPMQINLTVHTLENCDGYPATLNCADAFRGGNYSAVVTNEALYQQCARAAQDIDCNLRNGRRIRDARAARQPNNPWGDWSTARGCGL